MLVEKIRLKNFRNVRDCEWCPDPKLNFLLGPNGQGKTSFLEALGFLATLRSFKDSKPAEVIQWQTQQAEIQAQLGSLDWKTELKMTFQFTDLENKKVSKTAFINGKPYRSSTQYLSQRFGTYQLGFHTVVFNPSDHDLVRGGPSERRAYLDQVLAAEDIHYLHNLSRYQRLLQQRNAVLKAGDRSQNGVLLGFTEPLAQLAAQLTFSRLNWLRKLSFLLNETVRKIAPFQADLRAVYQSNWAPPIESLSIINNSLDPVYFTGLGELGSLELLEQVFWKKTSALSEQEWRVGHSLVGPHRDDWSFFMGNQFLKGHGSQGEVRSALLALKLSEIELFRNETGHRPLFLLDDFSSELDRERRSFLLRFLLETDLQVFVTTTEELTSDVGQRFWVSSGNLRKDFLGNTDEHTKRYLTNG